MSWSLHSLPAGHTLTATIVDGSGYVRQVGNSSIGGRVTNAAAAVYGPYVVPKSFEAQNCSVVIAESDFASNVPSADQKAMLDAIPATDPADDGVTIWNDEGVLKTSGASA
jgi:hypothetical protein